MVAWGRVFPLLSVALAATIPPAPQAFWSTKDAVDFYNQGTDSSYLYRLLGDESENITVKPSGSQKQHILMMETGCRKSLKRNREDCEFQDGGMLKLCSVFLLDDPERNTVVISCESIVPKRTRVRCRRPGCGSGIGYNRGS